MNRGIDVSQNNGDVDWAGVAKDGFHLRLCTRDIGSRLE